MFFFEGYILHNEHFLGLNTGEGGARVAIMQFSGKSGINKQSAFNRKDYFSYLGKDRVVDFNFVTKNSKQTLMAKIGKISKSGSFSTTVHRWSLVCKDLLLDPGLVEISAVSKARASGIKLSPDFEIVDITRTETG